MMQPAMGKLTLFTIFPLLGFLAIATVPARAQNRELELEKILNPMPDFDPFERTDSAPRYFPDEIDKRARELMIDALTNNQQALENHAKSLQADDSRLEKQHGTVSGLTEHAQDLLNNTIQDRERYLAAQKEALKNNRFLGLAQCEGRSCRLV